MESTANPADRARAARLGKSAAFLQTKVAVTYGSCAFAEAGQACASGFMTNPAGTGGDPIPQPSVWSAPLEEVPPGRSAKFHIFWRERLVEGFVVNFGGRYYAYVNHCVHAGTPLDWWPNEFFNDDRRFLTCGTHGSLYEPDTGRCAGGPCAGRTLLALQVEISNGRIVIKSRPDA